MPHLGFISSLFLSRLADQILLFLVPLVIFQITADAALSGFAFFVETLPRFIAFPICGILTDFFSPYRLLMRSQLARCLAVLLALLGYYFYPSVYWLVAVAAVVGVLTTQGMMAREAILPLVFNQIRFEKVLAHTQMVDQVAAVLGPLVAALLLSLGQWQFVLVIVALLFLSADIALFLWLLKLRPHCQKLTTDSLNITKSLKKATLHILQLPNLLAVIWLAFAVNLIVGVLLATSVAIYTGELGQSQDSYALLQALGAVATVLILLYIARTVLTLTVLGATSFVLLCAGGLMTALSDSAWVYLLGFLLVVGFDKMFNVFLRSLRKQIIPAKDFGKTTGLVVLFNNISQPLAGLAVALYASVYAVQSVVLAVVALAILIGSLVLMLLLAKRERGNRRGF
ncbi:MAG: MFS transporter [Oceanospirillaceae bacterium]|nr:MFS transporter [Oceanospirillaceae bacterium]